MSDISARIQLFDQKTTYVFQTQPSVDKYNMPLYEVQTEAGGQTIGMYPMYQGFLAPCRINGIEVAFTTVKDGLYGNWWNITQQMNIVAVGDGTRGPYTLNFPLQPNNQTPANPPINSLLRGHIDLTGIMAYSNTFNTYQDPPLITTTQITNNDNFIQSVPVANAISQIYITTTDASGKNVVVQDSGQFLDDNINYGLLMQQGKAPNGNLPLSAPSGINYRTDMNTVNYLTGTAVVNFPVNIPQGNNINVKAVYYQTGLPRAISFYNNVITLRNPPDTAYTVELTAYLTPCAFLTTSEAIPFAYMAEYIARGAARKILSDTLDEEQFNFYEGLFKEQETLVWKRSQRQFTSTRTETIYSRGIGGYSGYDNNYGGNL